jgi:hypothetical protein
MSTRSFDWCVTVLLLYFVVAVLAPLEPKNLFPGVGSALRYFVNEHRVFSFAYYFWRQQSNGYMPFSDDRIPPSPWEDFAQDLHEQTIELDSMNGICSRVRHSIWDARIGGFFESL